MRKEPTRRAPRLVIALSLFMTCIVLTAFFTPLHAKTKDGKDLLQFTSEGHVLGFSPDSMYLATGSHMLKVDFMGGKAQAPVAKEGPSSDRKAPPLSKVTYPNAWDGVDLVYEKAPGAIVKSTYTVAAGKSTGSIRLRYNRPLAVDDKGNLVIRFDTGRMTESRPVAWQMVNGSKRPVMVAYNLYSEKEVGFTVNDYDKSLPLVIDPYFTWNTFLGGTGYDKGNAIAVDLSGNVYVAGWSNGTWGAPIRGFGGGANAFVAKLGTDGALSWNTFLGGGSYDTGSAVAVDSSGNVYVAGTGDDTWGAPIRAHDTGSSHDAFVAKLTTAGTLTWNTFLGGSESDCGNDIAVDSSGNVYVAGYSYATWGAPVRDYTSDNDAFVAKLGTDGALSWNTFLGGSGDDHGNAIAVDSSNVYVAGASSLTWGAPVTAFNTPHDAFVAKLTTAGTLTWNTFLGGSGSDLGHGIAVDSSGSIYVVGLSDAAWGSPVRDYTSDNDVFVAKLGTDGALSWNTFLGGSGSDTGEAIAVDLSGNIYVAGYSKAKWGSPVRDYTSDTDAFVSKLTTGGVLSWNTFLGGSGSDDGNAMALDLSGNIYVAGLSSATWGSPVVAYAGGNDAFVVKVPSDPTVIGLTSFTATGSLSGITLAWETGTEVDTEGFHVLRSTSKAGTYKKITSKIIHSEGSASEGAKYTYTDTGLSAGTYYYRLKDIDTNGVSTLHGPVWTSVTAPTIALVSPEGAFPADAPQFQWEGDGVINFRIQFSKDPNFKKNVTSLATVITDLTYTPTTSQWKTITRFMGKSTALYWRVMGKNKANKSKTVISAKSLSFTATERLSAAQE